MNNIFQIFSISTLFYLCAEAQMEKYKYYSCAGSSNESEQRSYQAAIDDCYQKAISDNYGVKVRIQSASLETENATKLVIDKNISSDQISFNNFEELSSKTDFKNGSYSTQLKYRYLISEINKEKQRLKELSETNNKIKNSLKLKNTEINENL